VISVSVVERDPDAKGERQIWLDPAIKGTSALSSTPADAKATNAE